MSWFTPKANAQSAAPASPARTDLAIQEAAADQRKKYQKTPGVGGTQFSGFGLPAAPSTGSAKLLGVTA